MNSTHPVSISNTAALDDEKIEALYSTAHQLHTSGMRAKAHDLFAFIAAYRPRSIRFNKAFGISLMSNGDYEAAIPVLATAILCNPENDPALSVACAECLALTNRHRQARDLFQKARRLLQEQTDSDELRRLSMHTDGWLAILENYR
jgi:tetratricopeptide (TPR) repeat protein